MTEKQDGSGERDGLRPPGRAPADPEKPPRGGMSLGLVIIVVPAPKHRLDHTRVSILPVQASEPGILVSLENHVLDALGEFLSAAPLSIEGSTDTDFLHIEKLPFGRRGDAQARMGRDG